MTYIIAEAGVNHNGDLNEAARLCVVARDAGADAVKFQMFNSHELWGDDRIEHLELSKHDLIFLKKKCDGLGIDFMCTGFSAKAIEFLNPMVDVHKIGSGCRKPDILEAVHKTGKPVIISCGMAEMDELGEVIGEIYAAGTFISNEITLMQCTSSYPCKNEDVNLRVMYEISFNYNCEIGFSDHTEGIVASIAATALGGYRDREAPDAG